MATFQEYIQQNEDRDGIRMSWNVLPSSPHEVTNLTVNLACLYTPLKEKPDFPPVAYDPLVCSKANCKAILNPMCRVDYAAKIWSCNFCSQQNAFPMQYSGMSENFKPAELHAQYTTIEYILTRAPILPPIFLFVVDTCVDAIELVALKVSLQMALSYVPNNALIGLITFGHFVRVYELGCDNSMDFLGKQDYTASQVHEMLNWNRGATATGPTSFSGLTILRQSDQAVRGPPYLEEIRQKINRRFFQPITTCKDFLMELLGRLPKDPWPLFRGMRPLRSTGAALSVAVGLLESTFSNRGARIMLFTGGACTQGPGMVVEQDFKTPVRSHSDIALDNQTAKFVKEAIKHYEALARRACKNRHAIDIFACALDSTGLFEMKSCPNTTGGHMVMSDSFCSPVFQQSLQRVFDKDSRGEHKMAFNALMEVKTSRELKVQGAVGPCVSMDIRGANVSGTEIGIGGTSQWKLCTLGTNTTLAVFFEVILQDNDVPKGNGYIQFITQYQHSSGQKRVRVTTLARPWAVATTDQPLLPHLTAGFDQDAAAVLMTKLATYRADTDKQHNALAWLDRILIRLFKNFGEYIGENADSFQIHENLSMLPHFIFHFRRSQFFQVFNSSPDETTYRRHMLNRENCAKAMLMIFPSLKSYAHVGPSHLVPLDTSSIQPERILLLDTFFKVVIYHGEQIAEWREAGYHHHPAYQHFKKLLQDPMNDAENILRTRFPMPCFYSTDHGSSEARILLSKVNPSHTHHNMPDGGVQSTFVPTDDISLECYMGYVKRFVVSSTAS